MSTILPLPTTHPERRSRAKIARFPKTVRDQLNQMIQDGVPYKDIRTQLGDHGQGITDDNISEWKNHGGYNDWVHEQVWRDEIRTQLESFTSLATDPAADPTQLPLAGLEMSLLQICRQLRELGPGTRKEQFENDATKYLRMLNTLSRLTKSLLSLQQYRDTAAAKSARQPKNNGDSTADSEHAIRERFLDQADDLFGLKSAARLRREMQRSSGTSLGTPGVESRPVGTASPSSPDLNRNVNLTPLPDADPFHLKSEISDPHSPAASPSNLENSNQAPAPGQTNDPLPPEAPPLPIGWGEGRGEGNSIPNSALPTPHPSEGDSPIEKQNSKIETSLNPQPSTLNSRATPQSEEHCLECGTLLPALNANGGRPCRNCEHCGIELPPPGTCVEPSTEQCPRCHANLPRLLPNGQRPDPYCHHCTTNLPAPPTSAGPDEVYAVVG